jgi:hypothetical protein
MTILALLSACHRDAREEARARFSTEPIKISLRDSSRVFLIPRNYIEPNLADEPDEQELRRFGLTFFLPDYSGFTVDLAEEYPRRSTRWGDMIWVLRVQPMPGAGAEFIVERGEKVPVQPEWWGDPDAMFKNGIDGLDLYYEAYGLRCYGKANWAGLGNNLPCLGKRSNGESIFMQVRDKPRMDGIPYICDVRYYSEREQLYVEYRFPRQHLDKWREIDDAIWARLHSWAVLPGSSLENLGRAATTGDIE